LELAILHVSIIKFELVYPSLQEIFIKTVKQDSNQKVAV
jgi:ABC-type uncharacterized transport system ATPase subunit